MSPDSRDVLLTAIAKARTWIADLAEGRARSFAEIAKREGQVARYVRFLAPLAFVSPRIISAIIMLKRGEVDLAYLLDAPMAEEVKRDPTLKLVFSGGIATYYLDFFDMWDPKLPWSDRRVRLAANYAIDRKGLSQAETLGASPPTGNIVPLDLRVRAAPRAVPLRPRESKASCWPRPAIPTGSTRATSTRGHPTSRQARRS